jgi:ABC-2 type transport system permease protein
MKAFMKMLRIEFKLSFRDMNMLIFAVGMPLVIIVVLGLVYGNSAKFALSFSAIASVGILASGVMGLPLAISEYRDKKILKRFHCTPISSGFLFGVQCAKYAIYSIISLILVWIVSAIFGYRMEGNAFVFVGGYMLVMFSIYSIGMLIAAVSPNSQKAGIICTLLYFPMLILSGTTIPYAIMPKWVQIIANVLPMTQGINFLNSISLNSNLASIWWSPVIVSAIAIICGSISIKYFKWENK